MGIIRYCKVKGGNFGDDLNLDIWPKMFPDLAQQDPQLVLYGIGTLLGGTDHPPGRKAILGSGFGYKRNSALTPDWQVYWVRGPLTARKLRLDTGKAITDPAILWPRLTDLRRQSVAAPPAAKVGLCPHFKTIAAYDWKTLATQAELQLIDPRRSPEAVATQIAQCDLVLAESLHAAIIADALRVPWVPVVLSHRFNAFKWLDWGASIGIQPEFHFAPHYPHPFAERVDERLKGALWRGLAMAHLAPPQQALRPTVGSSEAEIARLVSWLLRLKAGKERTFLSQEGLLASLNDRMLTQCKRFAGDHGLQFTAAF